MSQSAMLTIVVPTRNRLDFLLRMLGYLRQLEVRHPIVVADSSDEDQVAGAREAIARAADGLSLVHAVYPPGRSSFFCVADAFTTVKTPYVVFGADDDFVIPAALDAGVAFLERHRDYTVAHGDAVVFKTEADRVHGPISWVERYPQRSIEATTAAQRITDHLASFRTTAFSLHRTEHLAESYRHIAEVDMDVSFGELFASCLPVAYGKSRKLPGLYMVRQSHGGMLSRRGRVSPFDWIGDDTSPAQYRGLRDRLAARIAAVDGVSVDDAREIVTGAFWTYVRRWQDGVLAARGRGPTMRDRLRRVGVLARVWPRVRARALGSRDVSLPALLRPSSPYHDAFMPVYRAVTEEAARAPRSVPLIGVPAGSPR